jgi:hypothetical protein
MAEESYADKIRRQGEQNAVQARQIKETAEQLKAVREAEEADKQGHLKSVGLGVARIPSGLFGEVFEGMAEIDEWSYNTFGGLDLNPFDAPEGTPWHKSFGYVSPAAIREWKAANPDLHPYASPVRVPQTGLDLITDLIPEPERFSGQFVERSRQSD